MNDITVNGLSFRYADSDQLILQDVNMRVREGDFVCLLGQSGCGKSTFLRLMAGLEAPSSGSICVDGSLSTVPALSAAWSSRTTACSRGCRRGRTSCWPFASASPRNRRRNAAASHAARCARWV